MQKIRLYFDDSYDPIITKIKNLTDNPSLTRIVSTFLDLMERDKALAKLILEEINSHNVDQQLKEWFKDSKNE